MSAIALNRKRIVQTVQDTVLADNQVHLWWADLNSSCLSTEAAQLTDAERARYDKRATEKLKRDFVRAHLAVTHLLSVYLKCSMQTIDYVYSDKAKPALPPDINTAELEFNFSHAGNYLLLGVMRKTAFGVDVEKNKEKPAVLDIAERFFSENEFTQLKKSHDVQHDFYRIWTAKEALVKATGEGIGAGLDQFSVPLAKTLPWSITWQTQPWWVYALQAPEGYVAAFACQCDNIEIKTFSLTETL